MMSKKVKETERIEVHRMCNLLHLNRDDIFEVCELCNCLIPYTYTYTKYRDPAKLIPIVILICLRHHNYLFEWE